MDQDSSSVSALTARLALYRAQAAQVETLLASDPLNTEYLSLQDDLTNVINLTEALLTQLTAVATAQAAPDDDNRYSPGQGSDDDDDHKREPKNATHGDAGNDDGDISDDLDESDADEDDRPHRVGDAVEVLGGKDSAGEQRIFTAVITSVIHSSEFTVKYFDFSEDRSISQAAEVTLPINSLRRIPPGPFNRRKAHVTIGMAVECKYAADGQWYTATVTEETKHGYRVLYNDYGNSEEVPLAYLRPPSVTLVKEPEVVEEVNIAKEKENSGKKKESSGTNGPSLIPIPANLQILPTDTEEVNHRLSWHYLATTSSYLSWTFDKSIFIGKSS